MLVAPLVLRAPSGPAAREARASLRSAPRLEARPGPPDPPAPSTLAVLIVCVLPARPRHHPLAPCPGRLDSPVPSAPVGLVSLIGASARCPAMLWVAVCGLVLAVNQ